MLIEFWFNVRKLVFNGLFYLLFYLFNIFLIFLIFLSLQKQTELVNTAIAEIPAVIAAASTEDNVTEEAVGAPLAMWELEVQNIELEKGEGGLGFSILDYQVRNDPPISRYFSKPPYLCIRQFNFHLCSTGPHGS